MDTTGPKTAIRRYIDAFNRSDPKETAAAFPGSRNDPRRHGALWHGQIAGEDWYKDVLREGEQRGAAGYLVTLDEPRHVSVTGDNAYAPQGWRIAASAWAKGAQ